MSVVDRARKPSVRHGSLSVVREAERPWSRWYVPAALAADLVVGGLAGAAALLIRFGADSSPIYGPASAAFPFVWLATLAAHRLYEPRYLGSNAEEYRRVLNSGLHLGAVVAILAYLMKFDVARGYVALALPIAVLLTLVGRHLLRLRLHRERKQGRCMHRVVAVGHPADVAELVDQLSRDTYHGLLVVGACLPASGRTDALLHRGIPVLAGFQHVVRAVELTGADTVAVVSSPEMSGDELRRLAWKLETTGTALIVSPGLVEVAGPRVSIQPTAGLSLLHVEHPVLSGARLVAKSVCDRGLTALGLLLLAPVFLTIGLAVRLTSPGPVIYRQRRVGVHGREFTMLKFRTMYVDADARRAELLGRSDGNEILFKMRDDPRVTRVGAVLRRYSLDELPQLVNVLLGHMSLVGPRPPLPAEVAAYPEDAHRRLLVKPGLTGLWQVSGRSDLSWEESLRLDLRYVDNWSFALDLLVLWKTCRAVVYGTGAY